MILFKNFNFDQNLTELAQLDEPPSFSRLALKLDIELIKKYGSSSARYFKNFVKTRLEF